MSLPRFFTVQQDFASERIEDVAEETTTRLAAEPSLSRIARGQSVAIAVGSRGIDRITDIVRAVVQVIAARGGQPFVVPAMGSHGGATGEGQTATLAALGITPESVGCPIKSSMETVIIGESASGIPLHFDHFAAAADHLVTINRIKPHTRLTGSIQSGLCKMLMIGLGKHRGAIAFHPMFKSLDYRLDRVTDEVIPQIVHKTPFLLGVAIVEDAYDSVAEISIVPKDELRNEEPRLLQSASRRMPRLPFDRAEFLMIDTIGKEISGTGLDTNLVGRKWHDKVAGADEWPKIDEIYVRGLSKKTSGNATGIGIAEYTHRRVVENTDTEKTRVNCITAGHPTAAAMPVWFDSDQEVLSAVCVQSPLPPSQRRWMWIRNTLDLRHVCCSEGFLDQARGRPDLEVIQDPAELVFDAQGDLI